MSLISKIQSLISSANSVTGESRTDLTACVQDLKDGYGGSTVEKGLVFSEYDSDGYPHKAELVGTWTVVPYYYCAAAFYKDTFSKLITSFTVPNGVTSLEDSAFESCSAMESIILPSTLQKAKSQAFKSCEKLKSITFVSDIIFGEQAGAMQTFRFCYDLQTVTFGGQVDCIVNRMFNATTKIELFDFSHCSTIPPLNSTSALEHKSGCVIKVPQSLLADWQAETNWVALTNVVWQGV